MKLLRAFMALVLSMSFMMVGCTSKYSKEPPEITVTIDNKELDYIVEKNKWDGSIFDREDTFKTIFKKLSVSKLPYIEIGKTVSIRFANDPPSKFTISDILIDKNGNQLYSDREIVNIPIGLKDGKGSFELKKNFASALSSYYSKDQKVIRGFRMIAAWG